jgi:signal transduction histidine kinase
MTNQLARFLGDALPDADDHDVLFERHPTPSLLVTRAGVIENANSSARRLLQAESVPLAGAKLDEFFPGTANSLVAHAPPLCQPRIAVRRTDGSTFHARVDVVSAGSGPASLLLACIEDLSEFEREIAAANKEFESLTAAAGHDLRGPIRILRDFTEALEDECGTNLSEEGRGFLAEILKASRRMEDLIDALLTFSRASRAELSLEKLDISTLIELVFYELRHSHIDRNVDCQVAPGIQGHGDVRLMMTVLRALIGNAWIFTARNPAAAVRCHVEALEGRDWICVSDNGAGFEMSQASRLFKPFTRLHRLDEFPGQGMGLAIAHRIIKRHGGDIEATSVAGQGTTVRFWLPPDGDWKLAE